MSTSDVTYLCIVCNEAVSDRQQCLECPICRRWQHRRHPETGVSQSEYYAAGRGDTVSAVDTWKCRSCVEVTQNVERISDKEKESVDQLLISRTQLLNSRTQLLNSRTQLLNSRTQDINKERNVLCEHNATRETTNSGLLNQLIPICIVCNEAVSDRQQSLECPICRRWQHRRHPETGVSQSDYYAAGRGDTVSAVNTWKCRSCVEGTQNGERISDKEKESGDQLLNSRTQDIYKKQNVLCEHNATRETLESCPLIQLIPEETLFDKIKNFLLGITDAKIVNTELSNWILDPDRSAKEILQLVSVDFQKIPGATRKRDQRAWLVFMVLHNISRIPGLIIEGTWLEVILCLIDYTYDFDFHSAISFFVKSQSTRNQTMQTHSSCCNWVIKVLSSNHLCISPYLQLELIRHIYNKKSFTSLQIQGIMQGVVNIISDLDPEHLFTVLERDLQCTPEHILFALHFPGVKENEIERQRNILGNKIQSDLKYKRYTKEIAFFANTIKYAGFCSKVTSQKYSNDAGCLIKYMHQCLSLFMFGSFNPYEYGKLYQSSAYKNSLLLPCTFDGIADITEAVVGVPMTFMSNKVVIETYTEQQKYLKTKLNYKKQFNKLMKRRNNLIRALDLPYSMPVFPKMFVLREINGHNISFNRTFQKEIYKQKYLEYKI